MLVFNHLRPDQVISFFLAIVFLLIQGGLSSPRLVKIEQAPFLLNLIQPSARPMVPLKEFSDETGSLRINSALFEPLSSITAKSYLVLDLGSGSVLLEKNQHLPLYPASTVKLMSVLIAKKSFPLDSILLTGPEVLIAGNRIGLSADKQVTVIDLIKASLVSSSNDAVQVLAYHSPYGYEGFIQAMNNEAVQLSLKNTHFANPTGLDNPQQYSTSFDLARLAQIIIKDPVFKNFITLSEAEVSDVEGNSLYKLRNTNQLLTQFEQVKGVKTGTTELAGQVLITYWEDQDYSLLIVVMGSEDRYQDTMSLINWVADNVTWQKF